MCTQMLLPLGLVLISTASISWRVDEGADLGQIAAVGDDWRSKATKGPGGQPQGLLPDSTRHVPTLSPRRHKVRTTSQASRFALDRAGRPHSCSMASSWTTST